MSKAEYQSWEERYSSGSYQGRDWPSDLLESWITRIPAGRALDLPSGLGRNALYLAENGWDVDAVDISPSAVKGGAERAKDRGVKVNWHQLDLDVDPVPNAPYELIVSCFYMNRNLIPSIKEWVSPTGFVVFEQHTQSSLDVSGPGSPAWRMASNELLRLFSDFRIVHYEEGIFRHEREGKEIWNALSRLVACKGDPGF
ncbi:MAG: methyltransferase domain-containing protein [Chloroflexi bacterium]|nr:methyltransferase domain-containing protein [Chloroflexota bacterium]